MISDLQIDAWNRLTALLDRLPHALLLRGAPGVGKLALAERFAQFLVCEQKKHANQPCGRCEGCHWFAAGSHPDIRYLEPESLGRYTQVAEEGEELKAKEGKPSTQIRIEQARALGEFVHVVSHRGGRRVAIVHPAEDMNTATANSLLKILEEPPAGAVFLLVSHRPARLLPTIRSRCVPVPVPVPDQKAAAAWLAKQGLKNAERWLAFAGGAPLRALEYATGERGEAIERVLRSFAAGDRNGLGDVKQREDLEHLAEVLQKLALDRAFALLTGRGKYGGGAANGDARAWLAYARAMGPQRALARHPLNPRLFAAEMVAGMPES
ncbi:MAG: DNA polymerase III subunit delta' [Burkholderiales bacterium]